MKIAIVSPIMNTVPPVKYGGIEIIVNELARGLAARGHMVSVFCSGGSTITAKNIIRIETSPYPTAGRLEENRYWEMKQFFEVFAHQADFDVLHFNYEPLALRFTIEGKKIDMADYLMSPAVFTFHNITNIPKNIAYYRQEISLRRHYATFVSENHRKPLADFFPKSRAIYNAIRIDDYVFGDKKDNYLLFLGRITRVKGILESIAVAKRVGIPLVIAAKVDQADRVFYEKKVKHLIDGKSVKYIGEVNALKKINLLKKARCLLFPVLWEEPFGLVMVEALACGTPVVAFRRGSVPEIIKNGVNGYIVNNVSRMAEAVSKIDSIEPIGCRKSVEEKFDVKRMVDEYEEFFLKIIAKKRAS